MEPGSILETELQREDGSYVQTVTSVLHWHFLQNVDGTLYIQRAPCASLGVSCRFRWAHNYFEVCVYSYVLKINAKDLYCTRAASRTSTRAREKLVDEVCDPVRDRDTCCDQASDFVEKNILRILYIPYKYTNRL